MSQAIVYLIRHGEKPPEPEADGLSAQGLTRANALPGVFGPQSSYNIKYILAEHPKKGESVMSSLSSDLILFSFRNTYFRFLGVPIDNLICIKMDLAPDHATLSNR